MKTRTKKLMALSLAIAMVCLMTACGAKSSTAPAPDASGSGASAAGEKFELKLGHINSTEHPWNIALEGFAKDVAEQTNGNVVITIYPSAQLGGERDVAEGLKLGTTEMGLFGTGSLQALDQKLIIEELPFAFPTREHAYKAMDGKLGEALTNVLKGQNLVALSYWESGYRHITNSKKAINSAEDMKGIKLRVPEAKMRIDTFAALGALPTPLAFSEVFTALQQKTVDGQENPLATIYASKFYEVQPHLAVTGHIWGSAVLCISQKAWDKLPADYQKIISENAEKWKLTERKLIAESDDKLLAEIEKSGVAVTRPDVAPFQEAVSGIWTEYESVFGKEMVDIVREYSK